MTCCIQRPCGKKEAAKRSLGLKEAPPCSLHRRDKTVSLHRHAKNPYYPWRRCAGTIKTKLRISPPPRPQTTAGASSFPNRNLCSPKPHIPPPSSDPAAARLPLNPTPCAPSQERPAATSPPGNPRRRAPSPEPPPSSNPAASAAALPGSTQPPPSPSLVAPPPLFPSPNSAATTTCGLSCIAPMLLYLRARLCPATIAFDEPRQPSAWAPSLPPARSDADPDNPATLPSGLPLPLGATSACTSPTTKPLCSSSVSRRPAA
ncbi:vegetative cell wall protein gp1-like [Triticum dicoccoides]|uniref:vegetative cell wall protein gp1-like n=1 Tax=Triticum dicoccoides TaxID=85692 RepID=UPI00188DDCBF|nr:vegetative cell wall protein gp1-like [Triticum dicoccoides]